MSDLELGPADNGHHIELHVGDTLTVRLDENPTTGFAWAVAQAGPVLELESSDFDPPHGTAIGAGGRRTFRFRARRAGTTDLALKLWREWEGDSSIIERFQVSVRVTG